MFKLDSILVYHWQAWEGFLISHLVADYCHLEAKYDDDIHTLEPMLTPNIRAVLFQINLSQSNLFPAKRAQMIAALKERKLLVFNTEIEDISKRHLHHLLEKAGLRSARAATTGPAQQNLFVKSNMNWGGEIDQHLPPELHRDLLPRGTPHIQRWNAYYSKQRAAISPALWSDHSVVIENYIQNPENSFFRIYGFGEAIVVVKAHSRALIKKISGDPNDSYQLFQKTAILARATHLSADLQEVLAVFFTHYPLAYFCLDIVHDLQQHTIIDLNLTPYAGLQPQTTEAVEFLIAGAQNFIFH